MDDFDFIDNFFCEIAQKEEDEGTYSLTYEQKVVLWIWHSKGLIDNGGFDNFLVWEEASVELAEMFKEINLIHVAEIFEKIFMLFPEIESSSDSVRRDQIVSSKRKEIDEELERLNQQFYESDELIESKLAEYIRVNFPNGNIM